MEVFKIFGYFVKLLD